MGILPISRKSKNPCKKCTHFDGPHSALLISLGQIYNDGCIYILDNNEINIIKDKKIILKGHRNKTDGLWDIPISIPLRHCANLVITRDKKTKTDTVYPWMMLQPQTKDFPKGDKNGNFLM